MLWPQNRSLLFKLGATSRSKRRLCDLSRKLFASSTMLSSPRQLQQPLILSPRMTEGTKTNFVTARYFETVSEYHTTADEILDDIQDAVEQALEDKGVQEFEVTYASGVLTMVLPPHGTWVLNKQTPNRQIWWSSPISGPRRYEYEDGEWVFTRDDSHSMTLTQALQEELRETYQVDIDL